MKHMNRSHNAFILNPPRLAFAKISEIRGFEGIYLTNVRIKKLEKTRDHPSFRTVSCILQCCAIVKTINRRKARKYSDLRKMALAEPCWEQKNI
jgi:hypothetical protein